MKLSELKEALNGLSEVNFKLPNGELVPVHFHVTEMGYVEKRYIDCGGTVRKEKSVSFQLWVASDEYHRLKPEKFAKIIAIFEKEFGSEDVEVFVEYQDTSISRYGLGFQGHHFELIPLKTACLAEDSCGVPQTKPKVRLSKLTKKCCSSDGETKCC